MSASTRQRKGTTLVETIVVIAVFSLLAVTITQLLIGGLRAWRRGQTRASLRADARYAVDQIVSDFRQVSPASGVTTPSTGAQSLVLAFTRYSNTTGGAPGVAITYTISDATRTLQRTDGAGTTVVAENVVGTDPRTSTIQSYFQWEDAGAIKTTMGIHLYLVDGASYHIGAPDQGLTSTSPTTLESVRIDSAAYWLSNSSVAGGVPTALQQAQATVFATPASLADPRGPFSRT